LQERKAAGKPDRNLVTQLTRLLTDDPDVLHKLRALWTLHGVGGIDEAMTFQLVEHPEPYVRGWAIQLALEERIASPELVARMTKLAHSDPSPVVRLYLASAMQRLSSGDRWAVGAALAGHAEDTSDA